MALSGKYGKLEIPKVAEGEPVFVIRAQDALAPTIVNMYQLLAASHNLPIAQGLDQELRAFRNWQGKKKMPD